MHDLFITHAWRYHEDWTKISAMLDAVRGLAWRNFSVPWHDPAMDPNSEVGGKFIRNFLETQLIPVDGVILLAGVYRINSARHWVKLEVEMARNHKKPIIGIPAIGDAIVADEVKSLCDATVGWDATALIATLDEIRGLGKQSAALGIERNGS